MMAEPQADAEGANGRGPSLVSPHDMAKVPDGDRTAVVCLAAHEPLDDPRVSWVATSLLKIGPSTVLGLAGHDGNAAEVENRQGFSIFRFSRSIGAPPTFKSEAVRLLRGLAWRQNSQLKLIAILLVPLLLIVLPIFWFLELLFAALGVLLRAMRLGARWALKATPITAGIVRPLFNYLKRRIGRLGRSVRRTNGSSRFADFNWLLRHILNSNYTFIQHVAEHPNKYQAVYCHDLDTLLGGIYLKYYYGLPVIYDAHENWPYANPGAPWYHVKFFLLFERTLTRAADVVLTVSEPLAKALEQRHGLKNVLVMPNAEPFQEVLPAIMDNGLSALANGRVSILFQGAFAPERGLDQVLDYWPHVDSSKVALFLRGRQNPERDRLEKKAEALGVLGKSVFVLPPVTEDQLIAASREADVGLIPYRSDLPAYVVACPNKLSQYMQAGCAILTADLPFVSKVVREAQAGASYNFQSRDSFVSAVNALSDRKEIEKMKANAREYTRVTYNWAAYEPLMMDRIKAAIHAKTSMKTASA